jgi:hypothetical protein
MPPPFQTIQERFRKHFYYQIKKNSSKEEKTNNETKDIDQIRRFQDYTRVQREMQKIPLEEQTHEHVVRRILPYIPNILFGLKRHFSNLYDRFRSYLLEYSAFTVSPSFFNRQTIQFKNLLDFFENTCIQMSQLHQEIRQSGEDCTKNQIMRLYGLVHQGEYQLGLLLENIEETLIVQEDTEFQIFQKLKKMEELKKTLEIQKEKIIEQENLIDIIKKKKKNPRWFFCVISFFLGLKGQSLLNFTLNKIKK